jgi:radical SAM superfamily enzyme YgiQ (UPF0313 family)
LISRKQDTAKTIHNLQFLRNETGVHLHTDLIAGLPGENLESFGRSFDQLAALNPHEIQLGILKRLRGTPIIRHTQSHCMVYNPNPPYNILSTSDMDSTALFRLNRFARYWDMIANSGRFPASLPVVLDETPFRNFMALSDWLFAETQQTHQIALPRLFRLLHRFNDNVQFTRALEKDFSKTGIKKAFALVIGEDNQQQGSAQSAFSRQQRHAH